MVFATGVFQLKPPATGSPAPRGYALLDRTPIVNRLIGSGGLFGWYGLFRTSKLGKCTWYVTNRNHAVVMIAGAKTVLVSPDDVDEFIGEIRTAVPQLASV